MDVVLWGLADWGPFWVGVLIVGLASGLIALVAAVLVTGSGDPGQSNGGRR